MESQCLEKSKKRLHAGQGVPGQINRTGINLQAQSFETKSSENLQDDVHGLFPRDPSWQQQLVQLIPTVLGVALPTPANFVLGQIPGVFKFIYQKCTPFKPEPCPSDTRTTACLVDEILKIFPPTLSGQLAKTVVLDILKRKGQDIYTPRSVLQLATKCNEVLQQPVLQPGETAPNIFSRCFLDAVKEMHPLQQYAPAALQCRANNYFDSIAKVCHDKIPTELTTRREMSRYYLQCFIDTASEEYKDKLVVRFARLWLQPYINHPDSMFNREKILDIAELCEDKTKTLPNEERNIVAFFCFFRNILSLHPRTSRIGEYLMKYEGTIIRTITEASRPKTTQSQFSMSSDGRSRSFTPFPGLNTGDNIYAQRQKELIDCVTKALISVSMTTLAGSSFTGLIKSKIPAVGGFIPDSNGPLTPPSIAQSFTDAVTPCFTFFSRDKDGNLSFDYDQAMNSAKETAKWNPAASLAIGAAAALAENVTVKFDKAGKPQYEFNNQRLGARLGEAVVNSNQLGRLGSKLMGWER